MKTYALILALLMCPYLLVHASIINAFHKEKLMLQKEIRNCIELLKVDTTVKVDRLNERKLKRLRKEYAKVVTKYAETEQLLSEMKIIDPDLYERVSVVTNAEGTLTHVFVRYVECTSKEFTVYSKNYFMARAYTCVWYNRINRNVCASPYGTNTVSITIGKVRDDILALAHEFAHVLYIVPNLSYYSHFFKNQNWNKMNKYNVGYGHSVYDPSFAFLDSVEGSFEIKYKKYLRNVKNNGSFRQN